MIESIMPVTMLLVNVERMVSSDEKRDWISPKWRFSKKDNGRLVRWSNSVVFHWMLVKVFNVNEVHALSILIKVRKSVKNTRPIHMTESRLWSWAMMTWSVTSCVPIGNNKPMASTTTEKAKIFSRTDLRPTMLRIRSSRRRRDFACSCWKFWSGHSSRATPVKLFDISWIPITLFPSAGSWTIKLLLRALVSTT